MPPTERALIRSALPNFLNFMRFLHPGRACAAKFASSTAELGWDGSLLHCKSRGRVVPSFEWKPRQISVFRWAAQPTDGRLPRPMSLRGPISDAIAGWTPGRRETSTRRPRENAVVNKNAGAAEDRTTAPDGAVYQTRQELAGYIGWPLVQPKALPNSSKFCTEPLTRQRPGEWGSVSAAWRADCSVWF